MADYCEKQLTGLAGGSNVAVITMQGSCCPVTLAHIQCFIEARKIVLGEVPGPRRMTRFGEALGFLSLNSDSIVSAKLREKGLPHIRFEDRAHLVELAVDELPWMAFNHSSESAAFDRLVRRFPELNFIRYALNGADDVLKYQKWKGCGEKRRGIVMCRPGVTEKLRAQIRKSGLDMERGWFIIGPELRDISSTAVREACVRGDKEALLDMLHPQVAEWCLTRSPYKPKAASMADGTSQEASSGSRRDDKFKADAKCPCCPRLSWNGQRGEFCCRTCGNTGGRKHGPVCEANWRSARISTTKTTQHPLAWKPGLISLVTTAAEEGLIHSEQKSLLESYVNRSGNEQQDSIRSMILQTISSSERGHGKRRLPVVDASRCEHESTVARRRTVG
jgi:nicotinic acid mononucleotide adenylyltransferase